MSWDNYSNFWVIDHIVPIRFFNTLNNDEMKICWNYKNLIPLLSNDNHKKNGNIYFSYILLHSLKNKDIFYNKLYNLISNEVLDMDMYIDNFYKSYING